MRVRLLLVALLLTACDPIAPTGLVLEGVLSHDDACTSGVALPLLGNGVLDTSALPVAVRPRGMTYVATLRLRNYERHDFVGAVSATLDVLTVDHLQLEIRRDGATIPLTGLPNPFLVPADGRIGFATSHGGPAVGAAQAGLVPEAYAEAIDVALASGGEIELRLRAFATTTEGTARTSTTASFPLRLCLGCLVTCAMSGTIEHVACAVGQDDPSTVHCD